MCRVGRPSRPPLPNWRCPRPGRSDPSGSCQSPGSRISPGPLRTRRVRRHNQTKTLENKLHLPFTFENFEAESGHSCLIFAAKRPNDLFDISAVQLVDSRSLISGARPDPGGLDFGQRHASRKPCTELPYWFDARFCHQAAYRPSCSRRAMPIPASASSTGRRLAARLPWKARATSWGASGVPALTSTC